jgi:hypothetical protein
MLCSELSSHLPCAWFIRLAAAGLDQRRAALRPEIVYGHSGGQSRIRVPMLVISAEKAGTEGEPLTTVRISCPSFARTKKSLSSGPPSAGSVGIGVIVKKPVLIGAQ